MLSSLVELDGCRPAAARGHLVQAADGSAVRNQSQEVSKNAFSCYRLRLWIRYCLKLNLHVTSSTKQYISLRFLFYI